jgi:hypothetical protein
MWFKQKNGPTADLPQIMQRPSRCIRNWDLRWWETGKSLNSSLIALGISTLE